MSSNAFTRSRPRARQQRTPRTHSCDHPRFLQLVNELARINDAKKKLEESEEDNNEDSGGSSGSGGGGCSSSSSSANVVEPVASTNVAANMPNCSVDDSNTNAVASSRRLTCSCFNQGTCSEAQIAPNGFRSLDNGTHHQSTSALHDNYYQLQQNCRNHHNNLNHHLRSHQPQFHPQQQQQQQQQPLHHHHNHHQRQHQHDLNSLQQPQLFSNNPLQLYQDERCPSKSSAVPSIGYAKLAEQSDFDLSNYNLDLRQDENRSKRKRMSNDCPANSKRLASSSSCGGSSSKKLKSAQEAVRPLSPSFTKCPICLLDCKDRDPSFTNTCFHLFCFVCIENWTKNKATCPLCRTKFTKIIYNIKSATSYDEKVASPIRRDDDDGYIADRLMLEHLSGLNSNPTASNRNNGGDEVQFLFENIRNSEVLAMPQYFVNQIDPRQEGSLHSFTPLTTTTSFNPLVPQPAFNPTSYPMASNYILFQPNPRVHPPTTSAAITSAYTTNTGSTNINSDPSNRRNSRAGRYIYSRSHEPPVVDGSTRASRTSSASINQPGVTLERHQQQQQQQQPQQPQQSHPSHHPHHHLQSQHRSTIDLTSRQNQRIEQSHAHIQLPYSMQPRQYNPTAYARRPYGTAQVDHHHILDLYRQMPDI